jgi:hypothetical protein
MSLQYAVSTGWLTYYGQFKAVGYSGLGFSRNLPGNEAIRDTGPIPQGRYRIGHPYTHPTKGPVVFKLTPDRHAAHSRTEFRIHGDNAAHDASQGCIILSRPARDMIANSNDYELEVVR